MPDYSLNSTAWSSAIQGDKGVNDAAGRWSNRSRAAYGLKSAIGSFRSCICHTPTNVRVQHNVVFKVGLVAGS